MFPKKRFHQTKQGAQGFLIPLAAILIVGIGVLAVAINQMASQSSQASVYEGLSAQAFYAAESGAYYGMTRLVFNESDRATVDANCTAISGHTIDFGSIPAAGLQLCELTLTCTVETRAGVPEHFYTIRSAASCGAGNMSAQRDVEVSSFL